MGHLLWPGTYGERTLTMLLNMKSTAVASITALSIALGAAAPAQALGKNERNFLKGVAATLIIGALIKEGRAQPQPAPAPEPVYRPHHPRPDQGSVIGSGSSVYSTYAARAFASFSPNERRAIQSRLRAYGYYTGRIDGSFGPATYRAIVAYARDTSGERQLSTLAGSYGVYDSLLA